MQYRLVLQQLGQAQLLVFQQREQLVQQLQQLVPEQPQVQVQELAFQRLEREQQLQQLVQVLQRQVQALQQQRVLCHLLFSQQLSLQAFLLQVEHHVSTRP
jgi:hypothetical protein